MIECVLFCFLIFYGGAIGTPLPLAVTAALFSTLGYIISMKGR